MLVFNMLYNMKLRIKFQESVKKVPVCLACKVKSRTFAPAFRKWRRLMAAGLKGGCKKNPAKVWRFEKSALSLQTVSSWNGRRLNESVQWNYLDKRREGTVLCFLLSGDDWEQWYWIRRVLTGKKENWIRYFTMKSLILAQDER